MSEEQIETPVTENRDFEAEAREQGWVPQEEFKGDTSKWKDAKKFIEDGDRIAALATKRKRDLERELDEVRLTLSQQQQVFARQAQKDRQERDSLIAQLEEARAKAITHGNGNEAVQLERQIRHLEAENQVQPAMPSPTAMAWHRNNPWYGSDEKLTRAADGIGQSYRALNPTASESEILDHVTERIRELSGMQGQRKPQSPDSGTPQKAAGKKSTGFSELPDEVKQVAQRLIRSKAPQIGPDGKVLRDGKGNPVPMTEEYYVKQYFGK